MIPFPVDILVGRSSGLSGLCCVLASVLVVAGAPRTHAALPDEIQVYTDDIDAPGQFGLELHVNTTPSGRSIPDYPGEITPWHGIRVTPEFSYGLPYNFEAGLYLPFVWDASHTAYFAGPRVRLKWLPLRPQDSGDGWFLGVNTELSRVSTEFEQAGSLLELRPIVGFRCNRWLVSFNPVLDWALAGPDRGGAPVFAPALKVAWTAVPGIAIGPEYYAELGRTNDILSPAQQSHTLYLALDVAWKKWDINFGIGKGLTDATDQWTVKAIIAVPF
jgi:hypothetical protein